MKSARTPFLPVMAFLLNGTRKEVTIYTRKLNKSASDCNIFKERNKIFLIFGNKIFGNKISKAIGVVDLGDPSQN